MIKWTNENQDLLPIDESKELPDMKDEWFDGEREQAKIKFTKCKHKLYAVSANEVRCSRCPSGWIGQGVLNLLKTPHK